MADQTTEQPTPDPIQQIRAACAQQLAQRDQLHAAAVAELHARITKQSEAAASQRAALLKTIQELRANIKRAFEFLRGHVPPEGS